jgi:hypothetical protein
MSELRVEQNSPRLLREGEPPPPPANFEDEQQPPELPTRYWTPDKAQHVIAQIARAGSKFYGPSVKAAEWELELIGEPAAAVLNDWLPLKVGATGDKTANLIAFAVVAGILVLLRLPDILEVHGIITPWEKRNRQGAPPVPAVEQPVNAAPAAAPPTATVEAPANGTFEPTLVGAGGGMSRDEEHLKSAVFGSQMVGGKDVPDLEAAERAREGR